MELLEDKDRSAGIGRWAKRGACDGGMQQCFGSPRGRLALPDVKTRRLLSPVASESQMIWLAHSMHMPKFSLERSEDASVAQSDSLGAHLLRDLRAGELWW